MRTALLLASPEYNFSMPGNLKNTIDWLSRIRPYVVRDRWALLLSASNGRVGGNRGLWHLRVPLESIGMMIFPDMFSLALAGGVSPKTALKTRRCTRASGLMMTVSWMSSERHAHEALGRVLLLALAGCSETGARAGRASRRGRQCRCPGDHLDRAGVGRQARLEGGLAPVARSSAVSLVTQRSTSSASSVPSGWPTAGW